MEASYLSWLACRAQIHTIVNCTVRAGLLSALACTGLSACKTNTWAEDTCDLHYV